MTRVKTEPSLHEPWPSLWRARHEGVAAVRAGLAGRRSAWLGRSAIVAFFALGCHGGSAHAAAEGTVLYSFRDIRGVGPDDRLIEDRAGNLYATAAGGGTPGDGVVFELSPPPAGQTAWTERVLRSFNGADGAHPYSSLIVDAAGNLYGTTTDGGREDEGVVFKLTP